MDENIDLKEVLRLHELWLKGYADGRCAYLCCSDLSGAYLRDADLRCADLCYADLRGACLRDADLRCANLNKADLRGAYLCDANLHCANLNEADLNETDLSGADLSYATVRERIFCLDRIGSAKRRTTYNATKDIVWCGCFTGTFKEWIAKIRKTYPDENNVYRKEYEAAIAFFKAVAEANEGEAQNG